MSNPTIRNRLEALEGRAGTALGRIVIGEDCCCLYMLDQPPDESEDDFRQRVRNLWLKDGRDPAQMPAFNW